MSEFNIHGSKIEQLSDAGNNYKLTTGSGNNSVSEKGNIVHSDGTQNRVIVDRPKESLWSLAWGKLRSLWKLVAGK